MTDTPHSGMNCLRTLLTACLVLLLVGSGTIAIAQNGDYNESWEDGNLDGYTDESVDNTPDGNIITEVNNDDSSDGIYQLYHEVTHNGSASSSDEVIAQTTLNDSLSIPANDSFTVELDMKWVDDGKIAQDTEQRIVLDDGSETFLINYESNVTGNDAFWTVGGTLSGAPNTSDPSAEDEFDWTYIRATVDYTEDEITLFRNGTAIQTAPIDGNWSNPNDIEVRYRTSTQFNAQFSTITKKAGYDNVTITGSILDTTDPSKNLILDADEFMRPGTDQPYTVTYVNQTSGGENQSFDVTDDANTTLSTSDSGVVSIRENVNLLLANSDEDTAATATITANFTDTDGEIATDSVNVTVAQPTMKNFDILPSAWRLNAMFSFGMGTGDSQQDTLPLWIFLTILVGVGLSALSTSFGGIGGMTMMMVVGWVAGYVGDGVMLATVFVGLFIGFNLAANIDYAVRRG